MPSTDEDVETWDVCKGGKAVIWPYVGKAMRLVLRRRSHSTRPAAVPEGALSIMTVRIHKTYCPWTQRPWGAGRRVGDPCSDMDVSERCAVDKQRGKTNVGLSLQTNRHVRGKFVMSFHARHLDGPTRLAAGWSGFRPGERRSSD